MNYDLSSEQQAAAERARAFAASIQSRAAEIDRDAVVPPDLRREAAKLLEGDELSGVAALEEIALESAAVAMAAAAPVDAAGGQASTIDGSSGQNGSEMLHLAGLRGAPALADTPRAQLALAAVALGVGRKALAEALEALRRATVAGDADVEKPHWLAADVATELDAARLLTYKAAHTRTDVDIALARLMASAAAERSTSAALRIVGPAALEPGSVLERLARDARAIALLLGGEERQRAIAGDGLYPR